MENLSRNITRMRLSRLSALAVSAFVLLSFARPSHAAVSKITIDPSSTSIASGKTVTFVVKAIDGATATDVTSQTIFSTNDPKGATGGATYTSGEVGSWEVQASYQSFLTTATITVTPGVVAEVEINPNSDPEIVFNGTSRKFTARAFDGMSNVVGSQSFTWSVIGTIGKIDANGVFTGSAIGTGKVQAVDGTITGQIAVEVQTAPVTNTNTTVNANTNTVVNVNSAKNTNVAANKNVNTNTAAVTTNTNSTVPTGSTSSTCTTIKPWVWTLILVLFLIAVAVLYGLVPVTKIWPVLVALVGAGVLAYVQRTYDCSLQTWWAWVITLGTIVLTVLAIRSKPMPSTKQ